GPWRVPGLASIPVVGSGFFNQPVVTYVVYLLAPAIWWWMYRTHAGLALRAVGEAPAAAEAAGVKVGRVRVWAILFGGVAGSLAGATLVLAQAGTFARTCRRGAGSS